MSKTNIVTDEYVFFLSSYLSQWFPARFVWDDVVYSNAEQYMMAEKARLFKDEETLQKILSTNSPSEVKSLGRKIRGFEEATWDIHKEDIVYRGNFLKFTQNPNLLKQLLDECADKLCVECNPRDSVWGIALGMDNPDIHDRTKWKGWNLLGNILSTLAKNINNDVFSIN